MAGIDLLLATYNGEGYLEDQIESFLCQTNNDWRLIVRDDGSSDETRSILARMAKKFPEKVMILEDGDERLGVIGNFSRLMETSSSKYTMFSDQDDLWLPDKIEISIKRMNELEKKFGNTTPILIHTDLRVVNEKLETIAESFWDYQLTDPDITSLNRLLMQNNITGCTMIINKALRDISLPIPEGVMMHDWWVALVAASFGVIDYLPQATILYRQHGSNVEGAKKWNPLRKALGIGPFNIIEKIKAYRAAFLRTQIQARLFLQRYENVLHGAEKAMLSDYAYMDRNNYVVRKYYFFKYRFFQVGLLRNIFIFLWI
jgi:glycosyltransferase involved in cell wall biosynthesis